MMTKQEEQIGKFICILAFVGVIALLTYKGIPVILIPLLFSFIGLAIALLLHYRDKRISKKYPPLPCENHKGTWSNPEFFTEEELKSKE